MRDKSYFKLLKDPVGVFLLIYKVLVFQKAKKKKNSSGKAKKKKKSWVECKSVGRQAIANK